MFIDNKYTKYYFNIINRASNRVIHGYTEKHHIIPKSMDGVDDESNIAILSAREHFICHLLLTKMVSGKNKHKAMKAARMMATAKGIGQQRYKVTNRIYEFLMQHIDTPECVRENMAQAQKLRFLNSEGTFKNKKHTEKSKEKMRKPKSKEQKKNQSLAMKGKYKGRAPHNKGKTYEELYGIERANIIKEKVKHPGEKNGFYGKKHSEEQRQRKREEKLSSPKKTCYYCNKEVDSMNFGRWHGDKCKYKK